MWFRRFIQFHNLEHPANMAGPEINAFLTHLAVENGVSASTQNQACSAILFLYRHVLKQPIGELGEIKRARQSRRLPVVLNRDEIMAFLTQLSGDKWLMASLIYGSGVRLQECLCLRVHDIRMSENKITVRDGKGAEDRMTLLPKVVKEPLRRHLARVKLIHRQDLKDGFGQVQMPYELERKYPDAARQWRWQWVFPQKNRWIDRRTGRQGRHHIDESLLQRAINDAAQRAGIAKHVTCHTLRDSFATHLLEDGHDIKAIQKLLGHKDVKTTLIYTRVLNQGADSIMSPIDRIQPRWR
jgi:integron integrase